MRFFALLSVLPFLVFPVLAADKDCHKVKESIFAPPRGWVKYGDPHPDHTIRLRIGLPQANFETLEKHLYEVSDPDHERYGNYLSKEDVDSLVAPSAESLKLVNEWLASHGLGEENLERTPAKDWAIIKVPVSLAEKMLDTKYFVWKHSESGDYLVRTTSYSLPEHLHDHVELIQPTTMFSQFKRMKSNMFWEDGTEDTHEVTGGLTAFHKPSGGPAVDPSCNTTITLSCLKQLYNFVDYVPKVPKKNSIAITSYLEEFANIADLTSFYSEQLPQAVNTSFDFISVHGGLNDQNISLAGGEANLDTQYAFGLSWPTHAIAYSTAGRPPFKPDLNTPTNTNEPYQDWLDFVLSHPNPPHVISTSYGEEEQTIPTSYMRRACAGFAQLGAKGVSLTFSSGDGGVGDGDADPNTTVCKTNDGRNATRFMQSFPSSCPYITSVGGTEQVPERAVFFSGGGFSDIFPRPPYQAAAVDRFLKRQPKGLYAGLFNPSGRATPDVAAQGRHFRVWVSGKPVGIGGTSASAPTFAAVVALLNDARIAKGRPPLGFLNPLLYSGKAGKAFNDITVGNNPGCGTPGFNATTGWDPVTGLGTPNFKELLKVVL